ncbi:pectinesterase inhibitor-like [Papaver somniferum]|uniref:pectinesterase inhibitor-like n=1 Tax=Papaver somniferum TaxID=3469 RepID=UPI000E701D28|nr:pectinesterase inhibitor-like [Papaver somniferum]
MGILVVLLVATTATATREVIKNFGNIKVSVDQVCSRTRNPGFCMGVLPPGVANHNLETVSRAVINQAMVEAIEIYSQIKDWIPQAAGGQQGHLNYCLRLYGSAINSVKAARDLLGSKQYLGLNRKTVEIANYANGCESSFSSSPRAVSPLTQLNSDFSNLVDVLSAISYLLSH